MTVKEDLRERGPMIKLFIAFMFLTVSSYCNTGEKNASNHKYVEGEYIIKLKDSAASKSHLMTPYRGTRLLSDFKLFKNFAVLKLDARKNNINEVLTFYKEHPDVEYIEPNYLYTIDDFKGFREE